MTAFLFLTWITATGYTKTDIVPMPNLETCRKVELRMKNSPEVEIKLMIGKGTVRTIPQATSCEEF